MSFGGFLITALCFAGSILLSTLVIRVFLPWLEPAQKLDKEASDPLDEPAPLRSVGFWIGFCETFLIFVFVFHGAFGALAIIMGAKEFVRKEQIAKNPRYYLLGTLANLCVALAFAALARELTAGPPPADPSFR